jgi:3-methyladenine DNA glycosylase AlkD
MPTAQTILEDLKSKGSEQTRKTYVRHGIPAEKTFGVSVADLKGIEKSIKGNQELACELYDTGIMEAMYLAGLVADGSKLTPSSLRSWVDAGADIPLIAENTVPWVTVENPAVRELALDWMASPNEGIACAGWCTYSTLVANKPDGELDLSEIEGLLNTAVREIGTAKNRVKLKMNSFVIAVGTYVKPLHAAAKEAAEKIGAITADMGDTACKIPLATAYIAKVAAAGKVGQKRKMIRC